MPKHLKEKRYTSNMRRSSKFGKTTSWIKTKSAHLEIIFVAIFSILYFLAGINVSLNRYWQYNSFWYDFGIFDETVWKISRFQLPIIPQLNPPNGFLVWGDHFNPSVVFLAPLYWISQRAEIMFIAQTLFVVLGALIIYAVTREQIKNSFARISILISYLGFVGMQNAIYTDVHNIVFALVPFTLAIWAIYKNNWKLYWLFLIITLGCQESLAGLGIGLGIFLIVKSHKNLKKGIATILLSFAWAILSTKYIMPAISGHPYAYSPIIPQYLDQWFTDFFVPADKKLKTILVTYATFGFTPLLSLATFPMVIEHFLERFVLNHAGTRWDLGFHYNALLSPIMALGSIEVLLRLEKKKLSHKIITFWAITSILIVLFIHRFYYHGPLMLATNPIFYQQTVQTNFLNVFEKQIPQNGLLMTQNNLASHFTHRNVVLLSKNIEIIKPDIVALDLRLGQNANNFFPQNEDAIGDILQKLSTLNYQKINVTNDQVIFKKINW